MNKCIILANGKAPDKREFKFLRTLGYGTLICADGGANSAYEMGLFPDYIIGDMDSISEETLKFYKNKCEIIKLDGQNDTDVEKCLKFIIKKRFLEVVLLGGTGDRLDHSFCNLGIVLKYFDKINISVLHEKSFLKAYTSNIQFKTVPGETISIYAFNDNTVVTSEGLKYQLKKDNLTFGKRESTSNEAVGESVNLNIEGGNAFVVREYNILKEHGFI